MPRTLGGLIGFIVTATITVVVGTLVYNRLVAPVIAKFRAAA